MGHSNGLTHLDLTCAFEWYRWLRRSEVLVVMSDRVYLLSLAISQKRIGYAETLSTPKHVLKGLGSLGRFPSSWGSSELLLY